MIKYSNDFNNNIILDNDNILDALKLLERQRLKVLFVVDKNKQLLGSVTDGDIRRAILNGVVVTDRIGSCANMSPVITSVDDIGYVNDLMHKNGISVIPYVNDARIICGLFFENTIGSVLKEKLSIPVVIMAGGQGKRLYPFTKILPKPLIPIEDTPISQRIIESFIDVGCSEFYMVVNYKKSMIKAYYADAKIDCSLKFIDEDIPLGTGGGIKLMNNEINQTFILTNCDILILEDVREIVKHHKEQKNDVTMVCSLKNFEIPYGIVNFAEGGEISSFEEKPRMQFFTNTGYYILNPCVMEYINENENIGMPDIIDRMRKDGRKIGIFPISENSWLDMGQFDSMESMERRLRELSDQQN